MKELGTNATIDLVLNLASPACRSLHQICFGRCSTREREAELAVSLVPGRTLLKRRFISRPKLGLSLVWMDAWMFDVVRVSRSFVVLPSLVSEGFIVTALWGLSRERAFTG